MTDETYDMLSWVEAKIQDRFNTNVSKFLDNGSRSKGIHISDLVYPCLPEGEIIVTGNGLKKVEDVVRGDKLLTHTGRFCAVTEVFSRYYSGEIIKINSLGHGSGMETKVTLEHPIYVRDFWWSNHKRKVTDFKWVDADDLVVGKSYSPYPVISDVEDVRASVVEWKSSKKQYKEKYYIPVNEHLMTIIGYYLAEGHISKNGYQVRFSFGKTDKEFGFANEVVYSSISLGYISRLKRDKYGWQVTINSVILAKFLEQFGKGAKNKQIPLWVKKLPNIKLGILFDSYVNGDGYERHGNRFEMASVSIQLIYDLKQVAMKLGYITSLYMLKQSGKGEICGRIVNVNDVYYLSCGKEEKSIIKRDEKYQYGKIQKLERKKYDGIVYNFEVEGDNSYCTMNHILHNCLRKAWFQHTVGDKELDTETKITFWIGHKLHELALGEENELKLMKKDRPVGTLDDLIKLDYHDEEIIIIVDKKTTRQIPKKINDHHKKQIEYYAALLYEAFDIKADYGAALYIDVGGKFTSVKAFAIDDIDNIHEEMMERYRTLDGCIIMNIPPPRIVTWLCNGKNKYGRKYCPFVDICESYGD